jgi:hypothetical protein
MSDVSALRAELRELRKTHVKPVSRMKKADISAELTKLREVRETTPPVAAVPSAPVKELKSTVESVKEAKKREFPVKPSEAPKKKAAAEPKAAGGGKAKKDVVSKAVSRADLMALLEKMGPE